MLCNISEIVECIKGQFTLIININHKQTGGVELERRRFIADREGLLKDAIRLQAPSFLELRTKKQDILASAASILTKCISRNSLDFVEVQYYYTF